MSNHGIKKKKLRLKISPTAREGRSSFKKASKETQPIGGIGPKPKLNLEAFERRFRSAFSFGVYEIA